VRDNREVGCGRGSELVFNVVGFGSVREASVDLEPHHRSLLEKTGDWERRRKFILGACDLPTVCNMHSSLTA